MSIANWTEQKLRSFIERIIDLKKPPKELPATPVAGQILKANPQGQWEAADLPSGGSVTIRKNSGADVGTRPRLNFAEGSNITLTVADDAGSNEVDIAIAAATGFTSPLSAKGDLHTHDGFFDAALNVGADGEVLTADSGFPLGLKWAAAGGGSTPTGTGFRHVTSGVEDAAAKLVDTADINNDQVTYAKIQNVAANNRILGRISGAGGDVEELTGTQATSLLDAFSSTLKGLAPASGGGSVNFLRADGTWNVPATNAHATTHKHGGSDEIATATPGNNEIPKADNSGISAGKLNAKWIFTELIAQASDATNNTTTLANTDLVFTGVANGVYVVDFYIIFQSAATTTGLALAWDTSVAVTFATVIFGHATNATGGGAFGDAIADATKRGITPAVGTINVDYPLMATGMVKFGGTGGTARLQFASEVASSQVLFKAGSSMRVQRTV